MKLSAAIRKGSLLTKPTSGEFFKKSILGYKACALGAAYYALTKKAYDPEELTREFGPGSIGDEERKVVKRLTEEFPILEEKFTHPTKPHLKNCNLHFIITDLNDEANWTREEIADWVEQHEQEI